MTAGDAARTFAGIADSYDRVATVLSLGQARALISVPEAALSILWLASLAMGLGLLLARWA